MTADPKTSPDRTMGANGMESDSGAQLSSPDMVKAPETANRERARPSRLDVWLHRVTVLMFVFVCAVVGVLLVILPWRPEWTDNGLLLTYPTLRAIVANGFFRGICSGLGILDIWIGFWEAVHYREEE